LCGRAARVTARDPSRAWLMTRMSTSYLAVTLFATFLPLPRSFALISPQRPAPHSPPRTAAAIADALDSMLQAGIPFVRPRCWRRAAVLHRYLALEGIRTQIVFGVIAADMQLTQAHAWVERDGQPFAEAAPVDRYRKIHTFG
jgi:hypothetical protein